VHPDNAPHPHNRRIRVKKHATAWAKGLLKYGIGFGLLAWVISKYWDDKVIQTGDETTTTPGLHTLLNGPIEYQWLVAAAILMATAISLQLFRWYILVRALDLPFSLYNAFRLGMVGLFYNTFLPGSVGGDLVKAYFIARAHPERKTRAVATVLTDRAMGLFGLILFVAVVGGVAWALGDPIISGNRELQWMVKLMAGIAGVSGLGFLLLGFLPQRRVDRFARRLRWFPKVGGPLAELWYAVVMYRQRLGPVVLALAVTALSHVCLVSAFHCSAKLFPPANPATDLATFPEHAVLAPVGFIVQAVPISPGGVGLGEAAFAGLYKFAGRPETRGVVARLSLRIAEWLLALIGYIIYLRMKAHHELPTEEEVEAESGHDPPENTNGQPPDKTANS
jgi:uncharacterized membrane protein YbhN (UPF0104 family)